MARGGGETGDGQTYVRNTGKKTRVDGNGNGWQTNYWGEGRMDRRQLAQG